MKRFVQFALILCTVTFLLFSLCSCMGEGDGGGGDRSMSATAGAAGSGSATGGETADNAPADTEQPRLPVGMLTAGAWNDNEQYSAWLSLFSQKEDEDGKDGKFYSYTAGSASWGYRSLGRVRVTVERDGEPIAGAAVAALGEENEILFSAVTDAAGVAYLFPRDAAGKVRVTGGGATAEAAFDAEHRELAVALDATVEKRNVIEVMFVVDVTGSMGDEIRFLKAELADVIAKIAANDAETVIKLALLFYRDTDDKVPFAYYDFVDVTTSEGMAKQQAALDGQSATGGGDYPEAVDEALVLAIGKQWSTGATTKLLFHVLDAPAHDGVVYRQRLTGAVEAAAEKGIRICPILCSGADEVTEYTSRQAAIYTGGTFIFVTDDSGIGNPHHDPELPNVTVELLNSMLVRLVNGYHTGSFQDPVYWKDDPGLYQE